MPDSHEAQNKTLRAENERLLTLLDKERLAKGRLAAMSTVEAVLAAQEVAKRAQAAAEVAQKQVSSLIAVLATVIDR